MNDTLRNRLNACMINKSIALAAPAGSGKTTVLVARILTLIAFGEDISSIIAITYTDNSAASIKERIIMAAKKNYDDYIALCDEDKRDNLISLKLIFSNSFIKSGSDRTDIKIKEELDAFIKANFNLGTSSRAKRSGGGFDPAVSAGDFSKFSLLTPPEIYLSVLNNLSNINISTFHGFFYKIINLFPIESGLLPGFSVIDENESANIKRNLINEFFLTRLSNSAFNRNKNKSFNLNSENSLEERLIDFFYVLNDATVNLQKGVDLILNSVLEKFDLITYSIILFAGSRGAERNYNDIFDYNIRQTLDSGIIEYLFKPDGNETEEFAEVRNGLENFEKLILSSFNFLFKNENLERLLVLLDRITAESRNAAVKNGIKPLGYNIKELIGLREKNGQNKYADVRFLLNFYKSVKSGLKQINYFINLKKGPLILDDAEKELIMSLYVSSANFYKKVNYINWISFTVIVLKLIKEYEIEKRSRNITDFSGIELKALMLLNSAEFQYVEEKLNYRIKHLVIDEFQDANRIEFELVKKIMEERLSGEGLSGERPIKGTVFFVGDPNQSIYGFRSSDYKIFYETAEYFKNRTNRDFKFEVIVLKENFRSAKQLVKFQNILFSDPYFKCLDNCASGVLCGSEQSEQSEYSEQSESENHAGNSVMNGNNGSGYNINAGGSIRNINCDNSGNSKNIGASALDYYPVMLKLYKNSRRVSENHAGNAESEDSSVAYEIRRILDAGKKVNLHLASRIKIVSRKHQGKGWDNLKTALLENNIPFKIYGDKGFYEKKEIDLILSILKFFFNDKDELSFFKAANAFAAVKAFNVADNDNYNDAAPAPVAPAVLNYFNVLSAGKYNNEIPLKILNFVKTGFEKLNKLNQPDNPAGNHDPLTGAIPYFILKKIYAIFKINYFYSKEPQALANLKKLLLISRNYGRNTVYEFLRDIEERINSGYKEPEEEVASPIEERENEDNGKISLMTIHGAKGLENDIVFLYGTPLNTSADKNRDIKYKFDIIFDKSEPEFILLNDTSVGNPLLTAHDKPEKYRETPVVSDISDRKREKEQIKAENEFKRLIYVALTRPRFFCCITDEIKDGKKNDKNGEQCSEIEFASAVRTPSAVSWSDILLRQKDLNPENAEAIKGSVLTIYPEEPESDTDTDSKPEHGSSDLSGGNNTDKVKKRFENIVSFIKNISLKE